MIVVALTLSLFLLFASQPLLGYHNNRLSVASRKVVALNDVKPMSINEHVKLEHLEKITYMSLFLPLNANALDVEDTYSSPYDTLQSINGFNKLESPFSPSKVLRIKPFLPQSALLNTLPLKSQLIGELQAYLESFTILINRNTLPIVASQINNNESTLWNNLRVNAQRAAGIFLYNRASLIPNDTVAVNNNKKLKLQESIRETQINVLNLVNSSINSNKNDCLRYMRYSLNGLLNVAYLQLPINDTFVNIAPPIDREIMNYDNFLRLNDRVIVDFTFRKMKNIKPINRKVSVMVDGINYPISSGFFINLVNSKFYDNKIIGVDTFDYLDNKINRVLFGPALNDRSTMRIPLEILRQDRIEKEGNLSIVYISSLSHIFPSRAGRFTAVGSARNSLVFTRSIPVNSFQTIGAIAFNHKVGDPNGSQGNFFLLRKKYEYKSTEAIARLDSRYSIFAYVIDGLDLLQTLQPGDSIVSARIRDGFSLTTGNSASKNTGFLRIMN